MPEAITSATGMAGCRAAAANFRMPGSVFALQDIERLDGVAVLVEADRTTQSGEAGELGHVIADLGAIGLEVFRLAGHAAGLDRVDIDADDLIDIGVVHAGFDFR